VFQAESGNDVATAHIPKSMKSALMKCYELSMDRKLSLSVRLEEIVPFTAHLLVFTGTYLENLLAKRLL